MPMYQSVAVVFIVFAVVLLILGGKSINCNLITGFIACTVLTLCVTSSALFGFSNNLQALEAIPFLAAGLIFCRGVLPDFHFYWEDFRFNYGFLLLAYLIYGWTFSNIYLLWFLIMTITLVCALFSLLFGGLFSGVSSSRPPRIHYPDPDDWIYFDD